MPYHSLTHDIHAQTHSHTHTRSRYRNTALATISWSVWVRGAWCTWCWHMCTARIASAAYVNQGISCVLTRTHIHCLRLNENLCITTCAMIGRCVRFCGAIGCCSACFNSWPFDASSSDASYSGEPIAMCILWVVDWTREDHRGNDNSSNSWQRNYNKNQITNCRST